MLVVGATYPEELRQIRQIAGDMTLLIPGIGTQGGDLAATMQAGNTSNGDGMIISSSRAVIFASDPKQEAARLRKEINGYR